MFKDNFRSEKLNKIGFPKLKGHVKVALKDVRNGKTDIAFEGDNMITDAVADIFASNLAGAMDYRKLLPLYSKMFGGVLCFKNTLDVSSAGAAKDYFIPDNGVNQVTAHAGQTTLSDQADDVTRGNPLSTAMTITDGAVTLAWEWGSTAGNGVISSVGLTHSDVGDAGTGSNSDAFGAMTPNINSSGKAVQHEAWFIDSKGYGYSFTFSGTTLTFTRFPTAYRKVGLVGLPYDYVAGIPETKTVTIGTTYGGYPYFAFDKATDKLYLFYNASSSTTVYVDIIDFSDFDNVPTPTHAVWTLEESVGAFMVDGNQPIPCALPIANGYVYLPKGSNNASGFLKVNLSSIAEQTYMSGTFKGSTGVFIPNAANRVIAGKCFVINNDVLYPTAIGTPDVIATRNYQSKWGDTVLDQSSGLVNLAMLHDHNASSYYPSVSKFYLASKFNLPTPITKSNTQSMVVTYTLTEVAENE